VRAQVSFSDRPLSVLRLSVRLSVNFYIFDFFSTTTGPILSGLGTNHPWGRGFRIVQMKGNVLDEGEIIAKVEKYTECFSLNLLQNQPANFNQTWYKSSLGKINSKSFK
jgi:hypothetical protein